MSGQMAVAQINKLDRSLILPVFANDAAYQTELGPPVEGAKYWNSTTKKTREFDGTLWKDLGGGAGGLLLVETKTIVTQNVIPALAQTPLVGSEIQVVVDGAVMPETFYSITGATITWLHGTAGFNIDPGDFFQVTYQYLPS